MLENLKTWLAQRLTLKDPALAELFQVAPRTLAGPVVNEHIAYRVSAVWDAVNQIAGDISKLPLNLHKRLPGGGNEVVGPGGRPGRLQQMVRLGPNSETRSLQFRRTLTQHALIYGNGYAEIVRNGLGDPIAMWPLHPSQVEPFYPDAENQRTRPPLRYRINGETVLRPTDILHIGGLSDDAVVGMGTVKAARETLGLALAAEQFAGSFFGHGTRFGGVLTNEHSISQTQAEAMMAQLEKLHGRSDKAFRNLILGKGWTYQQTGIAPDDAQMRETRDQIVEEVARFYSIPLHKLKVARPGAVSYASVEMFDLEYYKGPILTWITTWEQELAAKLIAPQEQSIQFFKHNVDALLRADYKTRQEGMEIQRRNGVLTANEWRELEDMNPVGAPGDIRLVNGANVPLDRLGDLIDKQVAPDPAPVAPPPADDGDEGETDMRTVYRDLVIDVMTPRARVDVERAMRRVDRGDYETWYPTYIRDQLNTYHDAVLPVVRTIARTRGHHTPDVVALAGAGYYCRRLRTYCEEKSLSKWTTDGPRYIADYVIGELYGIRDARVGTGAELSPTG